MNETVKTVRELIARVENQDWDSITEMRAILDSLAAAAKELLPKKTVTDVRPHTRGIGNVRTHVRAHKRVK